MDDKRKAEIEVEHGKVAVLINGVEVGSYGKRIVIEVVGDVDKFNTDIALTVNGDVGEVDCAMISCRDVNGDVESVNVTCNNIHGNVEGTQISCVTIIGSAVGLNVTTKSISP